MSLTDAQRAYLRDKYESARDRVVTAIKRERDHAPPFSKALKAVGGSEENLQNVLAYFARLGYWPECVDTGDEYEVFTRDQWNIWQRKREEMAEKARVAAVKRVSEVNDLFNEAVDALMLGDHAESAKELLAAFVASIEAV